MLPAARRAGRRPRGIFDRDPAPGAANCGAPVGAPGRPPRRFL